MKNKIKYFTIFCLSLFIILFNTNCEKEEWLELNLNETECYFEGVVFDTVTNYSGYIHNYPGTGSWVINGTDPHRFNFFPCNLASEYKTEGKEIIFDGELMHVVDYIEGEPQGDMPGTPIRLTYAKVKIK